MGHYITLAVQFALRRSGMNRSLLSPATILIASLAVLTAGVAGVVGELSPYFTAGSNADQRITALASYAYRPGASAASKSLILDDCQSVTTSLVGMAQTTARREALVTACIDYATAFTVESPANTRGWLVVAQMATDLEDEEAFNRGIRMSRLTAPASNWIIDDRLMLSRQYYEWLDEANRDGFRDDLRHLMLSESGMRFVAAFYNDFVDMREFITEVVETLDSDRQKRFVQLYARISGAVE